MNIAIDVDGMIARDPEFFALVSSAMHHAHCKVWILTSRWSTAAEQARLRSDLQSHGIVYDDIIHVPEAEEERIHCPHREMDDYQKYLWQKVMICLEHDVSIAFVDDQRLVELFKKFAPKILVFHVEKGTHNGQYGLP